MPEPAGHYHLHAVDGACYGDYHDFDWAIQCATEIAATWCTTWGTVALTVIDAPCCIYQCNDD